MEDNVEVCNNMNGMEQSSIQESTDIHTEVEGGNEGVQMRGECEDGIGNSLTVGCSSRDTTKQYACAPAPPVEIKLFVGRIPRAMLDEDVRSLFAKFGNVLEVAIIRDRSTNAHKGSAFVRMASLFEADAAIRELNGQKVVEASLGPIVVNYATGEAEKLGFTAASGEAGVNQAKLFVGSLPKSMSDQEVKQLFEVYGTVDEVFVMKDASGGSKGCAFVKFGYKEQAIYASKQLDGKRTLEGCNRPMEVRLAESKGQKNEGIKGGTLSANRMKGNQFGMGMDCMGSFFPNSYMNMPGMPNNSAPRMVGPWKEYFNNEGRPYYHNEMSNITQWDIPVEFNQLNRMRAFNRSGNGAGDVNTGSQGANVFVFHLPSDWTDRQLHDEFCQCGPVMSASIVRDRGGRTKGYGFVSYFNPASAIAAVNSLNGYSVAGKRLKVSIKQGDDDLTSGFGSIGGRGMVPGRSMGGGGMPPVAMAMMNQYAAMQEGSYGSFAGNRYAPY